MNKIDMKKEMLLNDEISVMDLNEKEVKKIKESFEKDLEDKRQELSELNQRIKDVKVKIDNWAN